MSHPPGAVPFKELFKLPKDTKLWWLSSLGRKKDKDYEPWLRSNTIKYENGAYTAELYLHAGVYFFTNYWFAYAHLLRVKAGAKMYDVNHRLDSQEA